MKKISTSNVFLKVKFFTFSCIIEIIQLISLIINYYRTHNHPFFHSQSMLLQIFHKGPFTQGIFRKSANARLVRELREKLDLGEDVSFEHVPVLVTAALLKEFLRSLPDPLLTSSLYPQYRAALNAPNTQHKLHRLKG